MAAGSQWRWLGVAFAALAALFILMLAGPTPRSEAQSQSSDEEALRQLDREGAHVYRQGTGEIRFIGTSPGQSISRPAGLSANASPEAAARAHLARYGKLFGIRDQSRELRVEQARNIGAQRSMARFQQVYKGVPVLGGELNVQMDESNNLLEANGEALPDLSLGVNPGVSAKTAKTEALASIAKQYDTKASKLRATKPKLWIYDPTILGGPGLRAPRLVWRTDVTPAGFDKFRELVLVDAQRGNVALNFDQVDTARDRKTYTMNHSQDESALPGTFICGETNDTCSNGDTDAKKAHIYARDTYDFYKSKHFRDSIDGHGMPIISSVHFGTNYQNAFWNGQQMVYGDGFSAADDAVGHELTHGVTQYESHLFYYYQSGAINESFSDVWGEFIDLTNGAGTDTAAVRWKIGEDIPGVGAIRDMKNPGTFGDPDRMLSSNYWGSQDDNGGVHSNSGVNNKAAYLMTDGDTFNGKTVTGLGITKVAKIYYEAQKNLLTSASDYQDLYVLLPQACNNLVGKAGITTANCQEVKDAVSATQMNKIPTAAPNPEAPVCNTGQTKTNLFFDNLESPKSGNWAKSGGSWYYPQNQNPYGFDATYATSGKYNFWGDDPDFTSGHTIAKKTGVNIPTGKTTYLRFRHAYGFEDGFSYYDGGVLEYSVNGGAWKDAGPLFTNNGYTGTISSTFDNPLGGRNAFVGESNGYISSRVNFSSLAGNSVRFRFRIGSDVSGGDYGWFVDDINVYTCS